MMVPVIVGTDADAAAGCSRSNSNRSRCSIMSPGRMLLHSPLIPGNKDGRGIVDNNKKRERERVIPARAPPYTERERDGHIFPNLQLHFTMLKDWLGSPLLVIKLAHIHILPVFYAPRCRSRDSTSGTITQSSWFIIIESYIRARGMKKRERRSLVDVVMLLGSIGRRGCEQVNNKFSCHSKPSARLDKRGPSVLTLRLR